MARFDRLSVFNAFYADGLVPLHYTADPALALAIVKATFAGGARTFEFTNRGDFAIETFSALMKAAQKECPDLILGVGTVEDAATAALFIAHGANFVVGPSFDADTARLCNRRKIAYVPGCGTITEIATAEEYGAELIKIFPATSIGGPEFIKAALGPRPWSKLMPTGGVTNDEANLREWFGAGVAAVGMGSHLIKKEWISSGNYAAITTGVAETLATIRKVRGQ